jgi:hypothetical protein
LDAYEHACQALSLSPAPHHEALLRAVHTHAVAHHAIPALRPARDAPMDLRALRPALARVALAEALGRLVQQEGDAAAVVAAENGKEDGDRPPLVLITGTGPIKASTRRFLRSKACFDPPFNPLPMPYNQGRLLLPWAQLRRWQAAGVRVRLTPWVEEGKASGRRQRLWGGMQK